MRKERKEEMEWRREDRRGGEREDKGEEERGMELKLIAKNINSLLNTVRIGEAGQKLRI